MAKAPRKKKEVIEAPVVTVEETQEVELVVEAPEEMVIPQEVYEEVVDNTPYAYGFTKTQWDHACSIYALLGPKTVNPLGSNIILRQWYGLKGMNQAKAIGAVFTLRVPEARYHLGNPFSSVRKEVEKSGLCLTATVSDSVICYICWIIYAQNERAQKIREWLSQGVLKGKQIVYYKELMQPSHATALEWLIYNWNA